MTEETKKKLKFWGLFVAYAFFSVVLPLLIIAWRFDLFEKVSKVNIGLWGLISIFIIGWFAISTYRWLSKGVKYSFATKCIKGTLGLPLIFGACALTLWKLQDNIAMVWQVIAFIAMSEEAAIILNPLPKWAYENGIEENSKMFDLAMDKWVNNRKGETETKK